MKKQKQDMKKMKKYWADKKKIHKKDPIFSYD